MRFQITRSVITYTVSMITSIHTSPSVSGTNRKWYSAVIANCNRDRSTTVGSIMAGPRRGGRVELLHDDGRCSGRAWPRLDEHEPQEDKYRQLHDNDDANLPAVAAGVAR